MEVLRDGSFSLTIEHEELAKGLRPSRRSPRNTKYLVECIGAVGLDSVLNVIDDLEDDRVSNGAVTFIFPYPQIFVCTNLIIVCGQADIYELVTGVLTHRLGPVTIGGLWSVIEIADFVYMSNGRVAVIRDPNSKTFTVTASQPFATSICNFNGQVLIGSPDVA